MANPADIQRNAATTKLDRLVTWRERMDERGRRGRNTVTYMDREVWAKRLETGTGYDIEDGGLIRTSSAVSYLMRYDSKIKPTDRIVDDGMSLAVVGVVQLDRRRWLEVSVEGARR